MTIQHPSPLLSATVVVGERRERAARCLQSILDQDRIGQMEVLLMDVSLDGEPPISGSDHPAVRTVRLEPETTFGQARAEAIRIAPAPVEAFAEEHVTVQPGWADALIRAHDGPWASVGPEVHNANPGVGKSDITGLMSYGLFYPPVRAGEAALLPGHNSSFKQRVLLDYGAELPVLLSSDNVLFGALRRDGHRLAMEPRARIDHLNETTLASVGRGYFLYHRCYGHRRAQVFRWPLWRRLAYVVLAPAIPIYFLVRFGKVLKRERPALLPLLLRQAPFVLVCQLLAALGQAIGLLLGPGAAERQFTSFEINEERAAATGGGSVAP
jgi:hypothetical protein